MHLTYWKHPGEFYRDKDWHDAWAQEPAGQLPLIRFHSLDAQSWLDASFTTRYGGVSTGGRAELNLGFDRNDPPENVRMNYARVCERIGVPLSSLALTQQVHETRILRVTLEMTVGGRFERKIFRTDGLWTDRPGITLSATFADCVPVFLAAPDAHQAAIVHSGWRGTAGKIAGKAVQILAGEGADPGRIVAAVGPCISAAYYEVTGEVIRAMEQAFSGAAMKNIAEREDETHWMLDLPAAVWYALTEEGVRPDNIHFSGLCTFENAEDLYSHRASRGNRGNMNGFLFLRE